MEQIEVEKGMAEETEKKIARQSLPPVEITNEKNNNEKFKIKQRRIR